MTSLRRIGRILLVAGIMAGSLLAWKYRAVSSPVLVAAELAKQPAAPALFMLVQVVASLLFFPRALLAMAADLMFGFWAGLLWATIGSWAGAIAGFLIMRYANGGLVDFESMPHLRPILARAEANGWRTVVLLRLVPFVPHAVVNYALGLTRMPLRVYALGSLLGQLPMTVAYIDLAEAGRSLSSGGMDGLLPMLIGVAILATITLLPRLPGVKRRTI